ncbi:MAG TPA: peptidoglycan-binding protein [Acidimicrobiales bacterium]
MPEPADAGLPLRRGSRGEAVGDVQRRLGALGHDLADDPAGDFDSATEAAVAAFQAQRGLPRDGIVGPVTWAALVESGWRLGDRFLYHRTPMQRGDDVAELQSSLGALGFDAGRVDGICGPDTARALEEFQRNSGLTADGICGPDSVSALRRLAGRRAGPTSVAQAREAHALRDAPRHLGDRRIVIGDPGTLDALADRVCRLLTDAGAVVTVLHAVDGSTQAREANDLAAELYVGLRLVAEPSCHLSFYATEGFESVGGRRLAELGAQELGTVLDIGPSVQGMRLPVLRETKMPAVLCELGPVDEVVVHSADLAAALTRGIATWVEHRLDGTL